MKTLQIVLCVVLFFCCTIAQRNAQSSSGRDSTGLPGDNFSLQGALEMFKQATSPEDFEKLLNSQDNHVNNLDLNGDGDIDYIRVVEKMDKDVHAFVLQVSVSETENQDVAVIELEKTGDATAMLQIIGDEDIYGEKTIVEPDGGGEGDEDVDDADKDGGGPYVNEHSFHMARIIVNVWGWPGVRFVYAPRYAAWVSPWRWRAYPAWWHPWRPLAWHVFHPFRLRYHTGFALVRTHRVVRAHRLYSPVRVTSVIVRTRHQVEVNHYRVNRTAVIKGKTGNRKMKVIRKNTRAPGRRR